MLEDDDHFLTSLYVHNAFAVRDLEIPIARDRHRRHLLLTGANGSGKSTILNGLRSTLQSHPGSAVAQWKSLRANLEVIEKSLRTLSPDSAQRASLEQGRAAGVLSKRALDLQPLIEAQGLPATIDVAKTILALVPANRSLKLHRPAGPTRIDEARFLRNDGAASLLLQFLVNLRTEQAYAREDGDDAAADRIGQRFEDFERSLRDVLDDDGATLSFERSSFDFGIRLGDGREVAFETLPDGISSVLFMWASLMVPAEAIVRTGVHEPPGWVLIDEPELHLHARLQEMVLPFLTTMFPNVQFIVATHSPAVLASIPNATIFDLSSKQAIDSADLQGIRYGTILTEHFGIETDFDLETTRRLRRLKALSDADPAPGSPEFDELRALAQQLSDLPHLLVAQVSKKLDVA